MAKLPAKPAKITGTKTPEQQSAALAKAKGPKAGSARANQSAKYAEPEQTKRTGKRSVDQSAPAAPKADPDLITSVKPATSGGNKTVVVAGAGKVVIDNAKLTKALDRLLTVGASYAAVQDYLAKHSSGPAMASGVNPRNSPQSGKALEDARKTAPKADAKPAESLKAAPKAAKLAPKGKDFTYAKAPTADAKLATVRPGSFREHMVKTILAHKDTASARAAHIKSGKFAKERLNFSWARDNGYITY